MGCTINHFMSTKYIFVTGGVVSGLGKGITAASLGRLLKARGLRVAAQKLDPYINVDPGTMSPYQHGEVFVTDDGAETDLDLGHYERFIDENLNKFSNLTAGKVYWQVLQKERNGEYLGQTVQVIPHITNQIKQFIYDCGKTTNADVVITEIGGTVGDIESQPFLETVRQIISEVGYDNSMLIHVTLVPYLRGSNEHKSKPTQHSVKELQAMGLRPTVIVTRSDEPIDSDVLTKIASLCNVSRYRVIENRTLPSLYEAPIMLEENGLGRIACEHLRLTCGEPNLEGWKQMLDRMYNSKKEVQIAIVGKYVKLHDAYLSVMESLYHAGYENLVRVNIKWVEAEEVTPESAEEILGDVSGILVPGGFGDRGVEGKITAAQYAREHNVPYFGICLGMQIAVIEFARNVLGYSSANSSEFDEATDRPVIALMDEQQNVTAVGGTMRLGAYKCAVQDGSILKRAYRKAEISERHRHRYEFNNEFRQEMQEKGLLISGTSPNGKLVEAIEIPANRFYVGVQYHPEFKSRPNHAHPLFKEFVASCISDA